LEQNLLIFLVNLISNKWSLFVAVALPYFGKKSSMTPMLCNFDPIGGIFDPDKLSGAGELHTLV
jgi:hypothetical protein